MEKRTVWALVILGLGSFFLLEGWFVFRVRKERTTVPPSQTWEVSTPIPEPVSERYTSSSWDHRTLLISAEIKSVDRFGRRLLLFYTWPNKLPLRDKSSWATITCSVDDTTIGYLNSEERDLRQKEINGADLFEYAAPGDYFSGFCADSECQTVGRNCRLHRK